MPCAAVSEKPTRTFQLNLNLPRSPGTGAMLCRTTHVRSEGPVPGTAPSFERNHDEKRNSLDDRVAAEPAFRLVAGESTPDRRRGCRGTGARHRTPIVTTQERITASA